jgi:hypothetical protein
MTEHLPLVRFIARRIHERLPQHVPIEDLYSAGVLRLLDAFGRFDPSQQVKFSTMHDFVSMERYLTVCEPSTGVLGFAAQGAGRRACDPSDDRRVWSYPDRH